MRMAIGIIFGLFIVCFVVIIVEEVFVGGRKRRLAEKLAKEMTDADNAGNRA